MSEMQFHLSADDSFIAKAYTWPNAQVSREKIDAEIGKIRKRYSGTAAKLTAFVDPVAADEERAIAARDAARKALADAVDDPFAKVQARKRLTETEEQLAAVREVAGARRAKADTAHREANLPHLEELRRGIDAEVATVETDLRKVLAPLLARYAAVCEARHAFIFSNPATVRSFFIPGA